MNIVNVNDALKIVQQTINSNINDEQIQLINDNLVKATYDYHAGKGNSYFCIYPNGILEKAPLKILAALLITNGWKAEYKTENDKEWISINLPGRIAVV